MPEKPASEKTEQPTPHRLRKAREEGMTAQSQELPAAVSVIVLTAVFALMAPVLMQGFIGQMKQGMSCQTGVFSGSKTFSNFFNTKIASKGASPTEGIRQNIICAWIPEQFEIKKRLILKIETHAGTGMVDVIIFLPDKIWNIIV